MWYTYTMDFYCTVRKYEILPFATTWVELENAMLREISQTKCQEPYDFIDMWDVKLKAAN